MGKWSNIEELEESLSLDELNAMLKASHDKEARWFKFIASTQGIDLDGEAEKNKERFELSKKRAEARLAGKTEEEIAAIGDDSADSFEDFGFEVEEIEYQ